MKTTTRNPRALVEPSNSEEGAWYWAVIDRYGEVFADGDGGNSYEDAVRKADETLREYRELSGM